MLDTWTVPVSLHAAAMMASAAAQTQRWTLAARGLRGMTGLLTGRARFRCFFRLSRFAPRLEALPQPLHQIDDFSLRRRGGSRQVRRHAFHPCPDELHEIFTILIGVFRRIPVARKV